jgi:Na+/H+ antiporter NhaD/arsenite permease-like protein
MTDRNTHMTDHHVVLAHDHEHEHEPEPSKLLIPVAIAIILLLAFYGYLLYQGKPQDWTVRFNTISQKGIADPKEERVPTTKEADGHVLPSEEIGEKDAPQAEEAEPQPLHPPVIMITPFVVLLLCIAFLPLIPATSHWWESNMNRLLVAVILGAITLLYYYFACDFPVEQHWPDHNLINPRDEGNTGTVMVGIVLLNAVMYEYIPFIVLLFSLFVITGGIRISGNFKATPFINTIILTLGALLASFIGTTGAAMLFIRFLLDINRRRKYKVHTVVFFIFTVCNAGGCLTPLGDPPLFLGYLRGIDFFWTFMLWDAWLFLNAVLLTMYFLWDAFYYRRESDEYKKRDMSHRTGLLVTGWALNVPLLLGVVASVAFLAPNKPIFDWYPPYYLREAIQLGLAAISLLFGCYTIRKKNSFNFLAIGEVAALFFGIFLCVQVPLQIISVQGKNMVAAAEEKTGLGKETLFFWTTASLSLFLDNAPTYVVFFETARTLTPGATEEEATQAWNRNTAEVLRKRLLESGQKENEVADLVKLIDSNEIDEANKMLEAMNETSIRAFKPIPIGQQGFIDHYLLVAIALGTVFIGGMTYIANGPNFMVKAIADHSGVRMPSFFGFMVYSFLLLLPPVILVSLIFV